MCKNLIPITLDFDAANPDNAQEFNKFRQKTTQSFNGMGAKKGGAIISGITIDNLNTHQAVVHISGKATKHQKNWVNQRLG